MKQLTHEQAVGVAGGVNETSTPNPLDNLNHVGSYGGKAIMPGGGEFTLPPQNYDPESGYKVLVITNTASRAPQSA